MKYKYRAKNGPDSIIEGSLDAASEKEAVEQIMKLGFIPLSLEEFVPSAQPASAAKVSLSGKVRPCSVTVFSRQLAGLLRSGVPLLSALNIISEQSESAVLKGVLRNIHNSIKAGTSFSTALSEFPAVFPSLYIALIRAGETSGALPEVLIRISEYRAKQEDLLSRLRMALAYPAFMAAVGLITVIFMLVFVLPRLTIIFEQSNQELPILTQILISLSLFLRKWQLWAALACAVVILKRLLKIKKVISWRSRYELKLPLFGKLILKEELGRFCRTMELLIRNGIPILNSLTIAIPVVNNEILVNILKQSYKDLEQGGSFGQSLKRSGAVPLFLSNLIIVAEESGRLADSLGEAAFSYEQDSEETIKIMSNLLEPLMILVMGLVVGFIVVAMLLPVFEINMVSA